MARSRVGKVTGQRGLGLATPPPTGRSCRTADEQGRFGAFVVSNDGSFDASHGVHPPPHSSALVATIQGRHEVGHYLKGETLPGEPWQ